MESLDLDIYLSHHHANREEVKTLRNALTMLEIRCWMDCFWPRPAGDPLVRRHEGIDQSRAVLLCITEDYAYSGTYETPEIELQHARNTQKKVIPVNFQEIDRNRVTIGVMKSITMKSCYETFHLSKLIGKPWNHWLMEPEIVSLADTIKLLRPLQYAASVRHAVIPRPYMNATLALPASGQSSVSREATCGLEMQDQQYEPWLAHGPAEDVHLSSPTPFAIQVEDNQSTRSSTGTDESAVVQQPNAVVQQPPVSLVQQLDANTTPALPASGHMSASSEPTCALEMQDQQGQGEPGLTHGRAEDVHVSSRTSSAIQVEDNQSTRSSTATDELQQANAVVHEPVPLVQRSDANTTLALPVSGDMSVSREPTCGLELQDQQGQGYSEETSLSLTVMTADQQETSRRNLENKFNTQEELRRSQDTEIHTAIRQANINHLKSLLAQRSIDINTRGYENLTPLMLAAGIIGDKLSTHILLKYGALVELQGGFDKGTAAHLASSRGFADTLNELLLRAPSVVHVKDGNGQTALHVAARFGEVECAEMLLKANSSCLAVDDEERLAKMCVCQDNGSQHEKDKILGLLQSESEDSGHNKKHSEEKQTSRLETPVSAEESDYDRRKHKKSMKKKKSRSCLVSSEVSRLFSSKHMHITRVAETCDYVRQLLIVDDRLWCLVHDTIHVFDPKTGQQVNTLPGSFKAEVHDMMLSQSGLVVVVTCGGLVVINTEGHWIHEIQGDYRGVTRRMSEEGGVWAVAVVDREVWLVKCIVSAAGIKEINRIKTHMRSRDIFSCTELRGRIIISSFYDNCLYVFDIWSGSYISTHGKYGQGGPGELYHPRGVYCDHESKSVLVMDSFNHRLQVLNLETDKWSVVTTSGHELQEPEGAVQDSNENIWICCRGELQGDTHYLYKCRVVTE